MPTFQYTAIESGGRRVAGSLAAANEQALLSELEARRLTPVRVDIAPERRVRGVSARALGQSYTQLGELLAAGVPLLRSLRLLANRRSQPRLAQAFNAIAEDVAQGRDFAESMSKRPETFGPIHIAMVRAGEKGGFLENVLGRLGQLVTAQAELRSKIAGSLAYPAMLGSVGIIVLMVIFGVFIPKFRGIFDAIPGGPPPVTRFVFGVSDLATTYGPYTLVALGLAGVGIWRLFQRVDVREAAERVITFSPIIGPLVRSIAAARFCRMLGTMLGNSVPIMSAMQIARDASGNGPMSEAIDRATESVRAGQPLARPLAESKLFDDDIVEMIAVAEAANRLDAVLITIAETAERRVDRLLTTAIRLIEPLLLLALAGVVVLVAAALVLPMLKMSSGL